MSRKKNTSTTPDDAFIGFRLSTAMKEELQQAATKNGQGMSEYLKTLAASHALHDDTRSLHKTGNALCSLLNEYRDIRVSLANIEEHLAILATREHSAAFDSLTIERICQLLRIERVALSKLANRSGKELARASNAIREYRRYLAGR